MVYNAKTLNQVPGEEVVSLAEDIDPTGKPVVSKNTSGGSCYRQVIVLP